ncbi:MAG: CopG family ribbon-helix-helix protein [Actinomycetota bacterium]
MATPRTFTISLPPKIAREVDRVAKAEGRTRSELFREAVRQYLNRLDRWQQIFSYGEQLPQKEELTDEDVARIVKERRRSRRR